MDAREAEREVHSLTFTSSLSSRSFSSRFQNHSHSNTFKQSSLCLPLQESLAVKSFSSPPCLYFLIVRLPIDGGGILPRCYLPPPCLLPASSAGDLDAETVAAVAVTRTQGHCCSPASTTNPAALDIFSVSRAGARQGKGTESGAVSALRVLVWCAPPPWRQ